MKTKKEIEELKDFIRGRADEMQEEWFSIYEIGKVNLIKRMEGYENRMKNAVGGSGNRYVKERNEINQEAYNLLHDSVMKLTWSKGGASLNAALLKDYEFFNTSIDFSEEPENDWKEDFSMKDLKEIFEGGQAHWVGKEVGDHCRMKAYDLLKDMKENELVWRVVKEKQDMGNRKAEEVKTQDRWSKAPSKQQPEEDDTQEVKKTNRFKR